MSTSNSKNERIHILGLGNLGLFFAHALAKSPNPPPTTLLLHRSSLISDWVAAGQKIEITTHGTPSSSSSFTVELLQPEQGETIQNLIVATKTIKTVSALEAVKHRLGRDSTVLFTQNGMGTMEEVTREVFKDDATRPRYLACVTSHGVYSQGPFRSVHAGLANVTIGQTSPQNPGSQYLIDLITCAPILSAREVTAPELLRLQLEKLVINAMINPLTAIFNCKNGELFTRGPIVKVMRLLLLEASHMLLSLPELRDDPTSQDRFSEEKLEGVVLDVAAKTAANTSSMLQDVRAGRPTEIDYINGHIVQRGWEAGVDCRNNEELVKMVKEGMVIGIEEIQEHFRDYGLKKG